MIVMKFGGTSVESAAAITRVAAIVRSRAEQRPLVVVSAMGKTTNRLLAAADKAAAGNLADALHQAEELRAFHRREALAVVAAESRGVLDALLEREFDALETTLQEIARGGEVTPRLWDEVSSYGERLSSALVALAFANLGVPAAHLDARSVLVTDSRHTQALPLYSRTYARLIRLTLRNSMRDRSSRRTLTSPSNSPFLPFRKYLFLSGAGTASTCCCW